MDIAQVPSPNFNDRKAQVDMLVLHYTGMVSGAAALARMCDPAAEVSAHYMVWEDGRVTQLVAEDKRAWHAGVSSWQGDDDLNSRSIGIEIVNGGHDVPLTDGTLPPYPDVQVSAVIPLCKSILARHAIPPGRVVGHSDIAPARKTDPGEHFPWAELAAQGVAIWPPMPAAPAAGAGLLPGDTGPPVEALQAALGAIGYGLGVTGAYDLPTVQAVRAFQRRWLPHTLTGYADAATQARIAQIAGALRGA